MMNRMTDRNRYERYIYPAIFVLLDYIAVLSAEYEALFLYQLLVGMTSPIQPFSSIYWYLWIPVVFVLFLGQATAYSQMKPILNTVRDIFYGVLFSGITCLVVLFFFADSLLQHHWFMLFFMAFSLLNIYVLRYTVHKIMKTHHAFYEPILLIGAGKTSEHVLRFFEGDLGYRYDVVGIIDDSPSSEVVAQKYKLYGSIAQVENIVRDTGVTSVIITAPGMSRPVLQKVITDIQPYVRNISYVPDLIGTPMAGVEAQVLFSEEILMMHMRNNLSLRRNRLFKRVFDLVLTIFGGLMISPVLLLITLFVAVENHGSVIFAHRRIGKNGCTFPCYKFQSMVPNAQEKLEEYLAQNPEARREWEESFKLTNDPRVTKLGAFLRKTSLDELPQLWNVIRGDMSLVGPRPIVEAEIERYGDCFREYTMVLPGITGMWQASGRSDTTYEERVAMDTWYVRNWSVWVDIMYLFKTVKAVFCGKGAY